MAIFNLSAASQTSVTWSITGLGNNFNLTYYQSAHLSTSSTGSPLSTITAPSSGGTTSTGSITTTGGGAFSAGNTYRLYGYVITASGAKVAVGTGISVLMYPASLSGLTASKSPPYAPATISFSWSSAKGATSYDYVTSSGGSGNTSNTFLPLGTKPAGTYSITVTPKNSSGSGGSEFRDIQLENPPIPSTPSTPTASRIEGGITASWNSVSGATSYTLKVRRNYDNYTETFNTSSTSRSVTELQYGVGYSISVLASNSYGSSSYSGENLVTTAPKTPTISTNTITNNSISINASVSEGTLTNLSIRVDMYSATSVWISSRTIIGGSGTVSFTSLSSGTTYRFSAQSIFNPSGTPITSINTSNELILQASARPADFIWMYSNISVGAACTVDHRDWNNLCAKINQFRLYVNPPLSGTPFTTVSSGMTITAAIYNQARNSLNSIAANFVNRTIPATKVANVDTIFATDFIRLSNAMNSIS